jgi:hypothetical protein
LHCTHRSHGCSIRSLGVIQPFIGDPVQQADELGAFGRSELLQSQGHVRLLPHCPRKLEDVLGGELPTMASCAMACTSTRFTA